MDAVTRAPARHLVGAAADGSVVVIPTTNRFRVAIFVVGIEPTLLDWKPTSSRRCSAGTFRAACWA
jgi:hypothetical protein